MGVWLASGAVALTGRADGPGLAPPTAADRVLEDRQRRVGDLVGVDVGALLGERAALGGLSRQGQLSCGGAARLMAAADGWCAVSLPRPTDLDLLPAWLGVPAAEEDPWPAIARVLAQRAAPEVAAGGQLLGIPCGVVGGGPRRPAVVEYSLGARCGNDSVPNRRRRSSSMWDTDSVPNRRRRNPWPTPLEETLVVDLSSLWAGPLCAHLLQLAGARVIKVEGTDRPDGARLGAPGLFALLHAGQQAVTVDVESVDGRATLRALLLTADVVIEGSRPRALRRLGVTPEEIAVRGSSRLLGEHHRLRPR